MSKTKKICICAVCAALCCVLPPAFHALALGSIFSPLHLPVLLCGLICGWPYGLLCGLVGPVLSSLLFGMPAPVILVSMVPELCCYGLCCGLGMKWIRTGKLYADLYLSLLPAMVLGRIVGGAASALFFLTQSEPYSLSLWISAYFVQTVPGIILQLIAIPLLVLILTKSALVPGRYPAQKVVQ